LTLRERDFFSQPLSLEELRDLLKGTEPAEAFAWRSPRAKALGLAANSPPADAELLRMMLDTPHLLRRPVIRIGKRVIFGFDKPKLEAALAEAGSTGGPSAPASAAA